MNKQIAIFATACLVVSLFIAGNILPRVVAQRELEKSIQSNPSLANSTKSEKIVSFPVICNVPTMSQGAKWEDHGCKLPNEVKAYPYMASCVAADTQSKDLEGICDLKPIR
jgi:hypothetical protein